MAKKQTRRSISVSRTTYERLKSFCEANGVSMSQFVETRVGDFLGGDAPVTATIGLMAPAPAPVAPPPAPMRAMSAPPPRPVQAAPVRAPAPAPAPRPAPAPMTSAAARFAVEPPPPIIKKAESTAPKAPTMPKADQIFTF
jgi:hypothetical protein